MRWGGVRLIHLDLSPSVSRIIPNHVQPHQNPAGKSAAHMILSPLLLHRFHVKSVISQKSTRAMILTS